MKFIKRHITAIIVTIIVLVLLVLAGFAVYRMFYPSNEKSVCGQRGNGPVITEEILSSIKDSELINTISYDLGLCETTIKVYIDVKDNVKIKDAQKLGEKIKENMTDEAIKFYDISVYLTQSAGEFKEYPAIGYHSKGGEKFNWVINKEVQ